MSYSSLSKKQNKTFDLDEHIGLCGKDKLFFIKMFISIKKRQKMILKDLKMFYNVKVGRPYLQYEYKKSNHNFVEIMSSYILE